MEENEEAVWIVYCSTGCSCCREDNHYRGPYSSLEKARAAVQQFTNWPLLSSQYAHNGRYEIKGVIMEKLPRNRFVIADQVFSFDDCPIDAGCSLGSL